MDAPARHEVARDRLMRHRLDPAPPGGRPAVPEIA